jgi:hypothetical protein
VVEPVVATTGSELALNTCREVAENTVPDG